jgi:hypothetical protein
VKDWSGRCRTQDSITANRQYGKRDGKIGTPTLEAPRFLSEVSQSCKSQGHAIASACVRQGSRAG